MAVPTNQYSESNLEKHIDNQISGFRRQLLNLTLRNPLLSCQHDKKSSRQIRIVDELLDASFDHLDCGETFEFAPLPSPRLDPDDENDNEFKKELSRYKASSRMYRLASRQLENTAQNAEFLNKIEREACDYSRLLLGRGKWVPEVELSSEHLAKRHGINPAYDLPSPDEVDHNERYHDDKLQTLIDEQTLNSQLRLICTQAHSDLRDRGVNSLFAAFGFLEWYEDDASAIPHQAPLVLVPVELEGATKNHQRIYKLCSTGEEPISNATLAEYLKRNFELELPNFDDDDTPDSYIEKIQSICQIHDRWQIRRFLTIQIFSDAKLAIYADLDKATWQDGGLINQHKGIRQLMSETGVVDVPYAKDHNIDGDEAASTLPVLIADADSSQHSAIVDALQKGNLTIFGPPGTGKSQTITNLVAAAMDANKSILFVAEKLTALDVVYKRLCEAGLGEYCFTLHSRQIRREYIVDELRKRVELAPPDFSQAEYNNLRTEWVSCRDALKLYASVMGNRIGKLQYTINVILWKYIHLREAATSMPTKLRTTQLQPKIGLTLTVTDFQEATAKIRKLAKAHRSLGKSSARIWRGVNRYSLNNIELEEVLDLLHDWKHAVSRLMDAVSIFAHAGDPVRLQTIDETVRASNLLDEYTGSNDAYNLEWLADSNTRLAVSKAKKATDEADCITVRLSDKYGFAPDGLPSSDTIRSISDEACALDCKNLSAAELEREANDARQLAENTETAHSVIQSLREMFEIPDTEQNIRQTINLAVERLRETPRRVLLTRTKKHVDERAHKRLHELQDTIEHLRKDHKWFAVKFNMSVLPSTLDLRTASQALKQARGLSKLSASSRRARRLFLSLTKSSGKTSASTMAQYLSRLAIHLDQVSSLLESENGKELMGRHWKGMKTDLGEPLEVANWAKDTAREFPGIGPLRSRIRHTLLNGDQDVLDEILNTASRIKNLPIEDCVKTDGMPKRPPAELLARAGHIERLSEQIEQADLQQDFPLNNLEELAELIDLHHQKRSDAAKVLSSSIQVKSIDDKESFSKYAELSTAVEENAISSSSWNAVVEVFLEQKQCSFASLIKDIQNAINNEELAWKKWSVRLDIDATAFFDGIDRRAVPLDAFLNRAGDCFGRGKTLLDWCRIQFDRKDVLSSVAQPILEIFESTRADIGQLPVAFEYALYRALALIVFEKHPDLQYISGGQLRDHKRAFRNIEKELQKLECRRIAYQLYHRKVDHGVSVGPPSVLTERALINYQLGLKRATISPRELIGRSFKALVQLKPCFMMSPTTVAEFLPRTTSLFDFVVIDESSQVLPADAIGAIARARKAVIVGDPQQLPPTTFFQGGQSKTEDDEDLATASESILDLAISAWRPHRYLRWHYRSQHSALIKFSNAKFYENRMIVFPGPNEASPEAGVRFQYVKEGIYSKDRTNIVEAQEIVERVLEFTSDRNNWERSLAVVTMNQPQRQMLDDLIYKASLKHSSLAGYIRRWENTLEAFTVKNLESVQGDERDIIFISIVFGPQTNGGRVRQTFGPITRQGGERRLNVLFTRARWRIDVFSSMRANDIQKVPGRSRGSIILRDYLEYAATGQIESGVATGAPTESPFEQHVMERLVAKGYKVSPQVGVASFRIDLGVEHSDYPHGFLLGIECDGATYHSAKSVRDRDRLREDVLRGLGWEIYRIWSTDWFKDADSEMDRLVEFLDRRLEHLSKEEEAVEFDSVGTVVEADEPVDKRVKDARRIGINPTAPALLIPDTKTETEIVEVGDTVVYRLGSKGSEFRKIAIVEGTLDLEPGFISDSSPLARALLGRSSGETVTVRQSNLSGELVIERIFKGYTDPETEAIQSGKSEDFPSGNGLNPYKTWTGTTPDPRTLPTTELAEQLVKIVELEGPVTTERLYRTYVRASCLRRSGRQVRRALNRALADLETRQIVAVTRLGSDSGYAGATVRIVGRPAIVPRDRGDRDLGEIPLDELAWAYRSVKVEARDMDEESIQREVLARYGLSRMTTNARTRFCEAAKLI